MAKTTRICRVCGKEYEYCLTLRRNPNMFRWQDVACCEEHGQQYLHDIMVSRGEISDDTNKSDASASDEYVNEEPSSKKKSIRSKSAKS